MKSVRVSALALPVVLMTMFAMPSFANFASATGTVTCTGYHLEFKGDVDHGPTGTALWSIHYTFTLHPASGPDVIITDTAAIPGGIGFLPFDVVVDKTFGTPLTQSYTITAGSAQLFVNGSPDATLPITFTSNVVSCGGTPPTGCTVTQGGWGAPAHGDNPGTFLNTKFPTAFPAGVTIGGSPFALLFTSAQNVRNFLPQGGPPSFLNASAVNPLTSSAGVFAGQVLALKLNVTLYGLGSLTLVGTGTPLDGSTVAAVLAAANLALAGGPLPPGFASYSALNDLIDNLNTSFDGCVRSSWAAAHLR